MFLSITSAVKSKKITANTVDDICSLLTITGVQINKRMDNRTMRFTTPPPLPKSHMPHLTPESADLRLLVSIPQLQFKFIQLLGYAK